MGTGTVANVTVSAVEAVWLMDRSERRVREKLRQGNLRAIPTGVRT